MDRFPDLKLFKRLLSFVNQEMDKNIRDYKNAFPHLFDKVFKYVKEAPHPYNVSGMIMESGQSNCVLNVQQSIAQCPKPLQSSESMGSMRDNARKGHARENASFGLVNCSTQFLPDQFHDDNGDALPLSDEAAPVLSGVGFEANGSELLCSREAGPSRRFGGVTKATGTGDVGAEAAVLLSGAAVDADGSSGVDLLLNPVRSYYALYSMIVTNIKLTS